MKVFSAKDYAAACMYKAATGGIMERMVHPTMGVLYIVRPLPIPEEYAK